MRRAWCWLCRSPRPYSKTRWDEFGKGLLPWRRCVDDAACKRRMAALDAARARKRLDQCRAVRGMGGWRLSLRGKLADYKFQARRRP